MVHAFLVRPDPELAGNGAGLGVERLAGPQEPHVWGPEFGHGGQEEAGFLAEDGAAAEEGAVLARGVGGLEGDVAAAAENVLVDEAAEIVGEPEEV